MAIAVQAGPLVRGRQRRLLTLPTSSVAAVNWIGVSLLLVVTVVAVAVPLLAPHDPLIPVGMPLQAPGKNGFLLGTDSVGRDILSRVLFGIRASWFAALVVVAVGLLFGGLIGLALEEAKAALALKPEDAAVKHLVNYLAQAKIVAENLVTANLTGHDSHGVGMIPRYIDSLLEGGLKVNQHPKMLFDGGAMISLAWLANKLIEHGKSLRAGDVILTGSVHPPVFLPGPGTARTEFVGLGGSEITIR